MSATLDTAPRSALSAAHRGRGLRADDLYRGLLTGAAGVVFFIVFLIAFESVTGAALSMKTIGWGFLLGTEWDPVMDHYGALPYMIGTLATSGFALLIAMPLGIGSAVFLAELAARRLGEIVSSTACCSPRAPARAWTCWRATW